MARRYVVTGRQGQVVRSLIEKAASLSDIEVVPLGRPELDLADPQTIETSVHEASPDLIISAAAYTAVDQAETDVADAFAINAAAMAVIGRCAARQGIPVVHLSTDYVFDGEKETPYGERDPVNPLGVYGRSKLEGERLLAGSGADHVILRTAWVYSPFGQNFLRTMLRLAESRNAINVVGDQVGNPTSALEIADGLLSVANNLLLSRDTSLRGVFHLTGNGEASWADFATEIFRASMKLGGPGAAVHPIPTSSYQTLARRPKNSRLNCQKLAAVHDVRLPDWKVSTAVTMRRLLSP